RLPRSAAAVRRPGDRWHAHASHVVVDRPPRHLDRRHHVHDSPHAHSGHDGARRTTVTEPAVAAAKNLEDVEDFTEQLSTTFDTCYTWSYETFKAGLRNLYEKAKQNQWDQATALDWSIDVDPEAENVPDMNNPLYGTDIWNKLTEREIRKFRAEQLS